jgi:hypothetical protein
LSSIFYKGKRGINRRREREKNKKKRKRVDKGIREDTKPKFFVAQVRLSSNKSS